MTLLAFPELPQIDLRAALRPSFRAWRGAGSWVAVRHALRGRGPRVVFLPSAGRAGAALLRIHAMAEAMRALGWCPLILPPTLTLGQRRRLLVALAPDVIVMQGAHHALNRPAIYPGWRIAYDMDDVDYHLSHLGTPVAKAMGEVDLVVAGSRYIADWAAQAGAGQVQLISTGTPPSGRSRPPQSARLPIVAWA